MKNETPEKDARLLLARIKRLEEIEADEDARDEAQRLLLASHLERIRGDGRAHTLGPLTKGG
jgi:hypothetical protein